MLEQNLSISTSGCRVCSLTYHTLYGQCKVELELINTSLSCVCFILLVGNLLICEWCLIDLTNMVWWHSMRFKDERLKCSTPGVASVNCEALGRKSHFAGLWFLHFSNRDNISGEYYWDKYMKVSCNLVMDTVKIEKEMSRLFVAYLLNVLLYRSHVRW